MSGRVCCMIFMVSCYEDKLHLVEKFQQTKVLAGQIQELLKAYQENGDMAVLAQAREIASQMIQI